jgi:hypothetical protein
MPKTIAILQSNYLPWKGYFDLMAAVDEFVIYDDVQYTRRDWRNRNRFKSPTGVRWLTIPVQVKGRYLQTIEETVVSDPGWAESHFATLAGWYKPTPHFERYGEQLAIALAELRDPYLSHINRHLLLLVASWLGIDTPLKMSSEYSARGVKSERLLSICEAAGATRYLSGPAARAYLDEDMFTSAGIKVDWMSYEGYPEYPQMYPPFDHHVSVLDLLFAVGPEAPRYMLGAS